MTSTDAFTLYDPPVVRRRRRPLHSGLASIGATLLIAAFVTDFAYWRTLLFQWNNFSGWLLLAGLIFAGLSGLAFLFDLATRRLDGVAWLQLLGFTVAALLSLLNIFVHSRDAYTAVVPEGISLSFVVAVLLVLLGVHGWTIDARRPSRPSRY